MDFTGRGQEASVGRQIDQDDGSRSEIREQCIQWRRVERGMLWLKDNVSSGSGTKGSTSGRPGPRGF
jgi:hypothetical protein